MHGLNCAELEMRKSKVKCQYNVFADYFHFSLEDDGIKPPVDIARHRQAIEDRLLVGDGYMLVGTVRDMDVPVTVEVENNALQLYVQLHN